MDCVLCKGKRYVMVKGYQTDKHYKVSCPYCSNLDDGNKKSVKSEIQSDKTCTYCEGAGEVIIEGQDGTPRTVTCGHCYGSGNE